MPKRSRLSRGDKRLVKKAVSHMKHDIKEQQSGIKRDQKTIKDLRKLI